jgi:hypothetical protein
LTRMLMFMTWRGVAIATVATLMGFWTLATLGFRAIWADVACGGPVCDQMRAGAAAGRNFLLMAWLVGMVIGATLLFFLARRRKTA